MEIISLAAVGLCVGLWGSVGTNAVAHQPPGSQLPITVLLFLTDQPANPSQQATVKIQTSLNNAVTLPLKCLSVIVISQRQILLSSLCCSDYSLYMSPFCTLHRYTHLFFCPSSLVFISSYLTFPLTYENSLLFPFLFSFFPYYGYYKSQ